MKITLFIHIVKSVFGCISIFGKNVLCKIVKYITKQHFFGILTLNLHFLGLNPFDNIHLNTHRFAQRNSMLYVKEQSLINLEFRIIKIL